MLWQLFLLFFKIGAFSFGGGYAVMTLIQREVMARGWIEPSQFQEMVTIAGMAPGSIATNTATLIGYSKFGILGAIVATAGIILPSLIIVICCAAFFLRLQDNRWMNSSFYGLRPIVTGLIVYAAIHFGMGAVSEEPIMSWNTIGMLFICGACLVAIAKYRLHPFAVILLSAAVGIVLF
ncbi:chromate transporter [Paenibacillus sp. FSL K6-1230]|uniref:chromate transporter n=1 Tax=Paenibacillus sp. FSL K6-1230 TaxID=2921603 RepID=UPI0030FAAC6F